MRSMLAVAVLAPCVLAGCGASAPPAPVHRPRAAELAVACDDALAVVGVPAVHGLAPEGSEHRGEIVGCAREAWLSAPELAMRSRTASREPSRGAHVLRIAYRTTRSGGESAIATARVFLPDALRARSPIAVIAHGTVGLADACAPSRAPIAGDLLSLPWAARGWPTIAPDYAGLGTGGVQGYGDGDDTARSTLDAARALRALLPPGTLSDAVVLAGHSQGGGAVLSAQSIAREYGAGGELALVVPIAPGWPVSVNVDAFRDPELRTGGGHELTAVVAAMVLYAWHARRSGEERGGDGFDPAHRVSLVRALERGCIGSLVTSIARAAPTVGALVDEPLRAGLVACADGGEGCTDHARELHAWMGANVLHGDARGAPVLVLQGARDRLTTPALTRCVVDHLRSDGVAPTVCVLDADHISIVAPATERAIDAAEAIVSGAAMPSCGEVELPACSPYGAGRGLHPNRE